MSTPDTSEPAAGVSITPTAHPSPASTVSDSPVTTP